MHAASRPPLARIAAIDRAIREGTWPNATGLARELEVSPRTVQRDLIFLRDRLLAPLRFDPRRNGYCYTSAGYQLPFFRLTEGELVAMFLAERLLRQYRGTYFEVELERAFQKIVDLLPEGVSMDLSAVAETLSVTPTVLTVQDIETFRTLARAVLKRRRLRIAYWTAWRNELTERQIDPYHLTLIDGDWYLIAHCHLRGSVRLFAAVRVRKAEETGEVFRRPDDFQVGQYVGSGFRVVSGPGEHRITLRFTPEAAGRAAEKIWHRSQTTEELEDGSLLLRMELSDLREVKRWILWWGAELEVVEPKELREMVRAEVERLAGMYVPQRL